MAANLLWREDVHRAARLVSLLRLLLLALSLGLWAFLRQRDNQTDIELWQPAIDSLEWLLLTVSIMAALMLVTVPWVAQRWQLVMHLVFDLLWVGMVIYFTGGISGPGAVLLFAVVLTSNFVTWYYAVCHAAGVQFGVGKLRDVLFGWGNTVRCVAHWR